MTDQQARTDKPNVFISYSRDDLAFVDQLAPALSLYDFEILIDRQGISGGEDWQHRLGHFIRDADTVVFVLSPSSAQSKICVWEVEEAVRLGKRIIPVVCRPLDGAAAPQQLARLNQLMFYSDVRTPNSGFGIGLTQLVKALKTDLSWLREHTRLLQRASEWKSAPVESRLLYGDSITEAKAWLQRRPPNAPEPAELHHEYIRASEMAAAGRLNEERRRLELIDAAQKERAAALATAEAAQKREADAQQREAEAQRREIAQAKRVARRTFAGLVASLALATVAAGVGYYAWVQKSEADRQAEEARSQTKTAQAMQLKAVRNDLGAQSQESKVKRARDEMDAIMWGVLEYLRTPPKPGETRDIANLLSWLAKSDSAGSQSRSLASVLVPLFVRALGDSDEQRRDLQQFSKLDSFSSPDAVRLINCFIKKKSKGRAANDPRFARKLASYEKRGELRSEIPENAKGGKAAPPAAPAVTDPAKATPVAGAAVIGSAELNCDGAAPREDPWLARTVKTSQTATAVDPSKKADAKKNFQIAAEIRTKYPELIALILVTESMDDDERQYWFDIMPSMTDSQIDRLYNILETERKKLAELELKYQKEIKQLNEKHLDEWLELEVKKGDKHAILQKALIDAENVNQTEVPVPTIDAIEKAIADVLADGPVTPDRAENILEAFGLIGRLAEEALPLSDLIGSRLGMVGTFDFDAILRYEELQDSLLARKLDVAKSGGLSGKLKMLRIERIERLVAKGQHIEAATQAEAMVQDFEEAIVKLQQEHAAAQQHDQKSSIGTNLRIAYFERTWARIKLIELLGIVGHLPEREVFPSHEKLATGILADVEAAIALAESPDAKDGREISSANLLVWVAATDPVFLETVSQAKVDEIADKVAARVDARLNFLDTAAVYYCATGRGDKAVSIYGDLLDRLKKRSLSSSETKAPVGFQWQRIAMSIKDCASGKIDPRTHAWEQYGD